MEMQESLGPHKLNHSYDDYLISGDVACCRGHFTLKDDSDKIVSSGK